MDGSVVLRWVEPLLGTILIVLVLADVYLTVLYARIGTGIQLNPITSTR
jgi:hypothetical protein